MTLVYIATGQPVQKNDKTTTFRGQSCKVLGWAVPRRSDSTGRVHLVLDGAEGWQEYYPSVINAEWRER